MARSSTPAELGQLNRVIDALASVPSRAARPVADALNEVLEEEFAEGQDPYGNAWAPLAPRTLRRHGPPPLTHTGEMREGTMATPRGAAGVEITVPTPGNIHQTGAEKDDGWSMPARPILPVRGMPAKWRAAINEAVRSAFPKGNR